MKREGRSVLNEVAMLPVGSPRFHASLSISPSTWHDAQEPVPFPESLASYRNPRPFLMACGVGSVPTAIWLVTVLVEVLIIEIELAIRFKQYNV